MPNHKRIFGILMLLYLAGCVLDHFEYFFTIENLSNINNRVYFSNDEAIDSLAFSKFYAIIRNRDTFSPHMDVIFEKKQYQKNPDKKLYLFIFDENKIDSLHKAGDYSLLEQAHKSFIERKTIDILNITAKDTIYIGANKKSE